MKKLTLIIIALIFQETLMLAQDSSSNHHILLSIGPAFPVSKFGSTDLLDNSSGFAKMGEIISVEYQYRFSKNWAADISLSGQRNPINTDAFEKEFSKIKIDQGFYAVSDPNIPPQQNGTVYPNWHFEENSWLLASVQVGVVKQFATPKSKLSETLKATIGAAYAKSPHLKGSSVTDTSTATIGVSKSSGFGLVYTVGGEVNYSLTGRVFLFSTLNYCGTSNITFKDIESTLTTSKGISGGANYFAMSGTTSDGHQKLNSINLLFGLGIEF